MKKLIELTLEQARELYKTAQGDMKQLLELNFTKSALINDKTKSILNFDDVLSYFNIESTESEFSRMLVGCTKKEIAFKKLQLIEKCFNDGKEFDEYSYWPWFKKTKAGLVFGSSSYYFVCSSVAVAVFSTKEDSDHVGKTFTSIYEDFTQR